MVPAGVPVKSWLQPPDVGVEKPGDFSTTVTATEQGTLRGLAQNCRGHDQASTAALQHSAGGCLLCSSGEWWQARPTWRQETVNYNVNYLRITIMAGARGITGFGVVGSLGRAQEGGTDGLQAQGQSHVTCHTRNHPSVPGQGRCCLHSVRGQGHSFCDPGGSSTDVETVPEGTEGTSLAGHNPCRLVMGFPMASVAVVVVGSCLVCDICLC